MQDNFLIRRRAKELLKGNWGTAILILIIYGALSSVSNIIVESFSSDSTAGIDGFLVFILSILVIPLGVGVKWVYLNLVREQEFKIEAIFEPYKSLFGKSILTSLLQALFVFLWCLPVSILGVIGFILSMPKFIDITLDGSGSGLTDGLIFKGVLYLIIFLILLMIPVIIKSITYAQAMFVLKENLELSPLEAITLSKKMMVGYKWKYFTLYLSFIGWAILCLLTFGIGFLWLIPYVQTTMAEFYNQLSREYNVSNEDV
ncbi:MAG: hypothetical protein K0R18_2622 [Bacillales bacterium]|jgi:uncharacterized membrane protein|nr:hypothetical protein [Bacillales bacterium]